MAGTGTLLETAQLQESALERASRLLTDAISYEPGLLIENREVRINSDGEFSRGLGAQVVERLEPGDLLAEYRARKFIDVAVLPQVRLARSRIAAAGAAPGRYVIPAVGFMDVITANTSSAEIEMIAPPDVSAVAARVWRKILDEACQLPSGRARVARGIVAIDIENAAVIPRVVDAMLAILRAGRPPAEKERVSGVDGILLRGRWSTPDGSREHVHLLVPSGAKATSELLQLARAAGGGYLLSHGANERPVLKR